MSFDKNNSFIEQSIRNKMEDFPYQEFSINWEKELEKLILPEPKHKWSANYFIQILFTAVEFSEFKVYVSLDNKNKKLVNLVVYNKEKLKTHSNFNLIKGEK